jgi:hypothetical protein
MIVIFLLIMEANLNPLSPACGGEGKRKSLLGENAHAAFEEYSKWMLECRLALGG